MWIADAARIREFDRLARDEFGISTADLMEQAGASIVEAVKELCPTSSKITVLCGKGNNGGDGLVAARLAKKAGHSVECIIAAEEGCLGRDSEARLKEAVDAGVSPVFYGDKKWERKTDCLCSRDLLIDALVGTGAGGEVKGAVKEAIQAINRSGVPVLAVDVPSGISCDTGDELGESVWALRTVTFGFPKPFLFQGIGLEHSGYWTVADIGYPPELDDHPGDAKLLELDWVANLLPERLRSSHKGENGSLLIVAGSKRMRGAAAMAAKSAVRAGIGLVTVAGIDCVCDAVAAQVPEALLLPLPEADGVTSPEAAEAILDRRSSYQAALFGPGMTHDEPVKDFLSRVWEDWPIPSCIDADALNAVSQGLSLPGCECVLTPHPGEMSRLLNSSIAEVQSDRFSTVRAALEKYGNVVLLKGPYSIVGEDDQPLHVNCTGNPGMASGGMGDVLGGVIATLLAQDIPGYYAASCAMFWHGIAADICACEIGPVGYGASDVADALPAARAKIVESCEEP